MTHRQTETSKELRLWIKDVIIPAATSCGVLLGMFPEYREMLAEKGHKTKEKIKAKIKTKVEKW